MFPTSTLLTQGRFEGGILFLFVEWAGLIFMGAAECEISLQFGRDESHWQI